MFDTKKLALFLGGVVFGSAGFKVLSSKDAKKGLHSDHRCGAADEGLHHADCEQGAGRGR